MKVGLQVTAFARLPFLLEDFMDFNYSQIFPYGEFTLSLC